MLGVAPRNPCRGGFMKVDIQTVPSLYIFLMTMFVVRNWNNFKSNSPIHSIDMRQNNQLLLPSVKVSSFKKSATHSSVKYYINYQ